MNELAPVQSPRVSIAQKLGWKWLIILTGFVLCAGCELMSLGGDPKLGTKYAANSKDTIYYSGNSTVRDAQALGEELKKIGLFDNTKPLDVLLHLDRDDTVISLVASGSAWQEGEWMRSFKVVGKTLATDLNLHPLKFKLVDDHLHTIQEIPFN